jgi:hypothetical protein
LCRGRSYPKYYLSSHKNGPFRRSGLLHSLAMFTTTDPTRPLNLMRPSHSVLASLLPQYSPSQIPSAKPETCCCLLRANKVTTLPCKLKLCKKENRKTAVSFHLQPFDLERVVYQAETHQEQNTSINPFSPAIYSCEYRYLDIMPEGI